MTLKNAYVWGLKSTHDEIKDFFNGKDFRKNGNAYIVPNSSIDKDYYLYEFTVKKLFISLCWVLVVPCGIFDLLVAA